MAKIQCANCSKLISQEHRVRVFKNKISRPIDFCCYECYLKFWEGIKDFVPLEEDKIEELPSFWWAKSIKENKNEL